MHAYIYIHIHIDSLVDSFDSTAADSGKVSFKESNHHSIIELYILFSIEREREKEGCVRDWGVGLDFFATKLFH